MKDRQKACLFAFVLAASAIPAAHASPSLTGGRTPSATPSVASCARAHPSIRVTPSSNAQRGGRQGSSVALITYGAATVALVADEDDRAIHAIELSPSQSKPRDAVTPLAGVPSQLLVLADGRVAVALRDKNQVQLLEPAGDPRTTPLASLCDVDVAEEPVGLAIHSALSTPPSTTPTASLLVTSGFGRSLTILEATPKNMQVARVIPLARDPRSVLVDDGGKRAFVSHVVGSMLSIVDLDKPATSVRQVPLDVTRTVLEAQVVEKAGQGFALTKTIHEPGVTSSPGEDDRVFLPMIIADPGDRTINLSGYGSGRPGPSELSFVGVLSEKDEKPLAKTWGEDVHRSRECLLPRAAVFVARRQSLLVACMGIDTLVELDGRPKRSPRDERSRWRVGEGPTGVAIDAEEQRAVVWSQFDHSLTIIPLSTTRDANGAALVKSSATARIEVARKSELAPEIARGRILFHKTTDLRLSADGRACASCHPDGRDDGLTWSTPSGPRQTIMLAGRTTSTAPFSWSGTNATIEEHVTGTFKRLGGTGMSQGDADLKALLAYVGAMKTPVHASVETPSKGRASKELVLRGRAMFFDAKQGCATCHIGGTGTDGKRHRVGASRSDEEIDTPSLRFVAGTAPYFHDGRFASLDEMLASQDHTMGSTRHLDAESRRALIAYLETL